MNEVTFLDRLVQALCDIAMKLDDADPDTSEEILCEVDRIERRIDRMANRKKRV